MALVSLGFGPNGKRLRRKVTGSTKAAVQDRLKRPHEEIDSGVRTTPNYTVRRAAEDWLREGLAGRAGRPSKSLTLEQASALLAVTEGTRMHAYISLCLATGIRTEEARELRWDHVDFGDPSARPPVSASAAVWRSVRADGDTKTEKSRRTLGLPQMAVDALRAYKKRPQEEQLAADCQWGEHGLVFATRTEGALDAANVRREFKAACRAAKIGEHWTPRELRHSFVSLMSSSGVPVEEIARLAGHSNTRTTEVVYRRELRPVLTTGAEAMDRLFRPPATRSASGSL